MEDVDTEVFSLPQDEDLSGFPDTDSSSVPQQSQVCSEFVPYETKSPQV